MLFSYICRAKKIEINSFPQYPITKMTVAKLSTPPCSKYWWTRIKKKTTGPLVPFSALLVWNLFCVELLLYTLLYCKSVTCLMYSIIWKYLQKELTVTYWYKCPDFFYNFISQIFGKLAIYIAKISKLTFIHKLEQHWSQLLYVLYLFILTSSNLIHMRLKAILICSRRPVIVTILSGQEASDMFIFAPLYKKKQFTSTIRMASGWIM